MGEDEDVNIIKKAEKEKREMGIAEQSPDISYSKYTVGGESKDVPASALDENDNFIHRREHNQPKQTKIRKK